MVRSSVYLESVDNLTPEFQVMSDVSLVDIKQVLRPDVHFTSWLESFPHKDQFRVVTGPQVTALNESSNLGLYAYKHNMLSGQTCCHRTQEQEEEEEEEAHEDAGPLLQARTLLQKCPCSR